MATVKPPLGIAPKINWQTERFDNLRRTIHRYLVLGLKIKPEWVEEYNELSDVLSEHNISVQDIINKGH